MREFVASKDVQKRQKLIDTLMNTPEFIDYWTFRRAGLRRREAVARVLALGVLEYVVLAPAALICAVVLLFGTGGHVQHAMTYPWFAVVPGFLAVLGPAGPLGFSTNVSIDDSSLPRVAVRARGKSVDLQLDFDVADTVGTDMALSRAPVDRPMRFLQMAGIFRATGTVAGRPIDFSSRGAAETFKAH